MKVEKENNGWGSMLLGSLSGGLLGLGKAVIGGIQANRGRRQLNKLLNNRPQYTIPEAYTKALGVYGRLASSEMPGQSYYEDRIGESTARTISNAERGAISSNAFMGAVGNAQDKELQAIQDLAKMGAEYKVGAMKEYAGAQSQYGQLQDKEWEVNKFQPWEIKANMAAEKAGVGTSNFWGGLNDMSSVVSNLVGTSYYQKIMKGLMGGQ